MESWLKVAWTLGVATLLDSASLPLNSGIVQEKLITLAIDFYIKNLPGSSVFKIIEYDSKNISANAFEPQQVKFRIKETVCQKSELESKEECDFKENGLIKNCTAFFMEQKIRTTCNTVMLKKSFWNLCILPEAVIDAKHWPGRRFFQTLKNLMI
ncbi:cathelicidin-6-like isoform X2 [Rhinatrema bivittatum]|uniref:cathelicidin-6-like isoform X2 n=1 Tax=Rhinatrema bivittatum TaxID=194408 RepID=UPI00112C39F7|nr:cathelicidin-6-like isoform X2 [Rhinatrema bivittatum]